MNYKMNHNTTGVKKTENNFTVFWASGRAKFSFRTPVFTLVWNHFLRQTNSRSRYICRTHSASIFGPQFWYLVTTSSLGLTFLQAGFTLISSHSAAFPGIPPAISISVAWEARGASSSAVCSGTALIELNLSSGHKVALTHNCQTNALICQNSASGKK